MTAPNWEGSRFRGQVNCVALVEVANAPQAQKHPGGIITSVDKTCVALRYLFAYAGTSIPTVEARAIFKIHDPGQTLTRGIRRG
jgi:hypothetical protein